MTQKCISRQARNLARGLGLAAMLAAMPTRAYGENQDEVTAEASAEVTRGEGCRFACAVAFTTGCAAVAG